MAEGDGMKKKVNSTGHVDALDKLCECKDQVHFLVEVFSGGGPPNGIGGGAEGLHYLLQRIRDDMEASLNKLSLREKKAV
jgi:hypothetical protein